MRFVRSSSDRPAFRRFEEDYKKQGAAPDINAAMFDRRNFDLFPIVWPGPAWRDWNPDADHHDQSIGNHLEAGCSSVILNPAPLFDMTRYVFEYGGPPAFKMELARFKRSFA